MLAVESASAARLEGRAMVSGFGVVMKRQRPVNDELEWMSGGHQTAAAVVARAGANRSFSFSAWTCRLFDREALATPGSPARLPANRR
jgi:hypothetical protein